MRWRQHSPLFIFVITGAIINTAIAGGGVSALQDPKIPYGHLYARGKVPVTLRLTLSWESQPGGPPEPQGVSEGARGPLPGLMDNVAEADSAL